MAENIHLLTKEIRSSFDKSLFSSTAAGSFHARLSALTGDYASDSIFMARALREYNRKLNEFDLTSNIVRPIDAGFRPLNDNFFGTLLDARSNQQNQGFSSSDFQILWDGDKRGVNIRQDSMRHPLKNYSIRLFHESDGSVSSFPAKFSVQFDVIQNGTMDVNTTVLTSGNDNSQPQYSNATRKPLFLSFRDDDATDESPDFNNKNFSAITKGFNSFNVELFDDGDPSKPSISIIVHRRAQNFDVDIKNIEIRKLP